MKKSLHNRRKELAGERKIRLQIWTGKKIHCLISEEPTNSHCFRRKFQELRRLFLVGSGNGGRLSLSLIEEAAYFFLLPAFV